MHCHPSQWVVLLDFVAIYYFVSAVVVRVVYGICKTVFVRRTRHVL